VRQAEGVDGLQAALLNAARGSHAPAGSDDRARDSRWRRVVLPGVKRLTAAERKVLALALTELTGAQIARHLFIQRGTVNKHFEHVYAELGLHTRREVRRWARRNGVDMWLALSLVDDAASARSERA
jgi:DNA-binding CsgD family transcriptional regulator